MNHLPIPKWLLWLSAVPSLVFFVYLVWTYVRVLRDRPQIAAADIVYQEWFASGHSCKNFITKIGGARNCLKLVVTRDLLRVTSWFPFGLFASFYDMEHTIPLNFITSIRRERFFGRSTLLVSFIIHDGSTRTVRLIPKDETRFLKSLRIAVQP